MGPSWIRTTETSCWLRMRRCWVFHSRLVWGVVKTYLLRPLKMSSRRSNKMLWERTTETSRQPLHRDVVGCFIWDAPATSLGRTERPHFGVVTTFCCWMGFYLLTIGIEIFFRSIPLELFLGKVVLKTCCKFTGEHPCGSEFQSTLQSNFIEITLWHECSPVNLLHIFRTPFPEIASGGQLLILKDYSHSISCLLIIGTEILREIFS